MLKKIKTLFSRFGCLHNYVPESPLLYGSFSRGIMVCSKCGKKQLVENTK